MTAVSFSRLLSTPSVLAKGIIRFVKTGSSTAAMYIGGNNGLPVKVETVSDAGAYCVSVWKQGGVSTTGQITDYNAVWVNDNNTLNTSTGVYTVPVTGLYSIEFDALKQNNNTATEVRLHLNGSPTGVRAYSDTTTNNEYDTLHLKASGWFYAGNTLTMVCTIGAVHTNESCYLNIHKVR